MPHLACLLHLADSALPTGSFAYSYGLESSLTFGLLRTETEFRSYLYSFLQQAVGFELPFITSAAHVANGDLGLLLLEYDAQLLTPTLHRASLTQGKNWLKLLATFYPEATRCTVLLDVAQMLHENIYSRLFQN